MGFALNCFHVFNNQIQIYCDNIGSIGTMDICSGNADAVTSSSGVTYNTGNSTAVLGVPDGNYALLYDNGDRLVLDLTDELNSGATYTIRWARGTSTSGNPNITVEESSDNSTWTAASGSPFTLGSTSFFNQNIIASTATRYLRFTSNNIFDADIDAVSYSNQACGGSATSNLNCTATATEITGTVFEDFNYDGQYDSGEHLGVKGIPILATDSLGNDFNAETDANGNYTLSGLTANRTYRIEFTFPDSLSWASPTFYGVDNGTTVQFVQAGNCANLGVANPDDYCQANPNIATNCYLAGGITGSTVPALVSFSYDISGHAAKFGTSPSAPNPTTDAEIQEIGATWGLAWQASEQRLFASSVLKRHVGLGPRGLDGVYVLDYTSGSGTVVGGFDLQGIAPVNGGSAINLGTIMRTGGSDYTLGAPQANSIDLDAFAKIGKVGIGDIDLSEDGKTLWMTNLNQVALITLDVSNYTPSTSNPAAPTDTVKQYILSSLSGFPSCTGGDFRIWGLKLAKGKGYIGGVCNAESSQNDANLVAYVLSFDPANIAAGLTEELSFDLDHRRELAIDGSSSISPGEWNPWAQNWTQTGIGFPSNPGDEYAYPQPILSDIELAEDGDMILGFIDRFGMQSGYRNVVAVSGASALFEGDAAGDIIHACNVSGNFVLEGLAGCPDNDTGTTTPSSLTNDGPSNTGEFYFQDYYDDLINNFEHNETALGGLAILLSTGEVASNAYNPLHIAFSQGTEWHNTTTGQRSRAYRFVDAENGSGGTGTSKGNGLGDLELLCNPAPIEIGNYVWADTDGDGIQDAGELGLEGLRIELYDSLGNLLAFDTTNALGYYFFSQNGIDSAQWQVTNDSIEANTSYYIVAGGGGQFASGNLTLNSIIYELTQDSTDSGANRYAIDSDGTIANSIDPDFDGEPYVRITTGGIGEVDHTFDFGFRLPGNYDYGDLPDIADGTGMNDYETYDSTGGPSHLIIAGLFLGDTVDVDIDGLPDTLALGDDTGDGFDDEDGITIRPTLDIAPGTTFRLPLNVTNTTGNIAHLEAWIDWNGDGDFEDTGEMVIDIDDSSGFPSLLQITTPTDAKTGSLLGFRLRLSNTNNMTPYGRVDSGEVEDYLLGVACPQVICFPVKTTIIRKKKN